MTPASTLTRTSIADLPHASDVSTRRPSLLLQAIIVLVLLVQEYAFMQLPAIDAPPDAGHEGDNVWNTAAVGLSLVAMAALTMWNVRPITRLTTRNTLLLSYMLLVLMSVVWSAHPDLTIRRGVGYVLTMLVAICLTVSFSDIERMKILSASFAVSAIGSFIFVAVRPEWGIMHIETLEGNWRGVFPHKTVLGLVMAIAIFTELYLLVAGRGRPLWRLVLLGLYLALMVLSRSATALLMSAGFIVGCGIYLLWARDRVLGHAALLVIGLNAVLMISFLWMDPESILGLLGKDAGLTGRTELWDVILDTIQERPLLGHGYGAMWGANDAHTIRADNLTGNWGVKGSHNAFLEIALQLGIVGLILLISVIGAALLRGSRRCADRNPRLGWFSMVFFIMAAASGLTELTLGTNQNIIWLVFVMLTLSCGPGVPAQEPEFPSTNRIHMRYNQNTRSSTRNERAPTG